MNIILLSGGSGKRLWPLSNDIRSKQFIKLFKNSDGTYESMVQRVYRQITTVDPEANVTIATSKSQVSAIRNQLGSKVDICIEPCRRDTFPAIVLAAVYLYSKGVSEDESVAVCPVDPFIENSYYETVQKIAALAAEETKNLTLMGIEPTYPSEKYGYIIPVSSDEVSDVFEFKEKPDAETAKKYIEQGALWNGGVFAFRLGYLLRIAHKYIDFADYDDLFAKYETLNKISFDYAVVEKESEIQVVRYSGEWSDVGTWGTMTDVMSDNVKGNAMLDDTCENTKVINELDIPVLCMGCKDLIVAASSDGILVSDKERSAHMKSYVEKIDNEVMYAEKSWGTYTVLDIQQGAMTIRISLQGGSSMKYHSHELRSEVWTVVSGRGLVVINGIEKKVSAGDTVDIPKHAKHTVFAETDMSIIEVQIGESISGKDKKVYEGV